MSTNGKPVMPFPVHAGVPLVGQPCALEAVSVPVNARLRCTCGGADTVVQILNSVPASCPSCHRTFVAAFNPLHGKLEIGIVAPATPEQPS